MIQRVLIIACVVMGVLLLVVAWHLRDPESPQSVIVASHVNNQVALYRTALGGTSYWRQLAPPFKATGLMRGASDGDSFYFWTYNYSQASLIEPYPVDLTFYQIQNDGSNLHLAEPPASFDRYSPPDDGYVSLRQRGTLHITQGETQEFTFTSNRPPISLPPEVSNSTILAYGVSPDTFYIVSGSSTRADLYACRFEEGHFTNLTARLKNGFPVSDGSFRLLDDDKVVFFKEGSLFNLETGQTIPITFDFYTAAPLSHWQWHWLAPSRLLVGHSPDGRVVGIRVDDGAVVWSLVDVQALYISPTGEWLLYGALDGSFRLIEPDGEKVIAPIPKFYSIVAWSDDYILYKTYRPRPDQEELWRMNPDGSNRVLLTNDLIDTEYVAWSPNYKWLVLRTSPRTVFTNNLWAVRVMDGMTHSIGPLADYRVELLAWGPPLPKSYTYFSAATFTGLLFLLLPFMTISIRRFMRTRELSHRHKNI